MPAGKIDTQNRHAAGGCRDDRAQKRAAQLSSYSLLAAPALQPVYALRLHWRGARRAALSRAHRRNASAFYAEPPSSGLALAARGVARAKHDRGGGVGPTRCPRTACPACDCLLTHGHGPLPRGRAPKLLHGRGWAGAIARTLAAVSTRRHPPRAFLAQFRPAVGVLMETESLAEPGCGRRARMGVPMVAGPTPRLSEKSQRRGRDARRADAPGPPESFLVGVGAKRGPMRSALARNRAAADVVVCRQPQVSILTPDRRIARTRPCMARGFWGTQASVLGAITARGRRGDAARRVATRGRGRVRCS